MKPFRTALLLALLPLLSACAGSPESLAKDLQAAFEKGDIDAVLALSQLDGTPSDLRFFLMDQVIDCGAADTACTASVAPLDEKFAKSLAGLAEQGLEAAVMPEGLIVLQIKQADGQGSGKAQMPYAKVDGKYRLVAQRYTAAKLAEMRASTNQQILDKMLAAGIYDSTAGERRTDWKDSATELPADGGEPGQVLVRTSTALHAAVLANDPDAAVKSGDGFAKFALGDKDYDGKPIPLELRKAKLRAQSMRFLHDIKVSGGWIRGDEAVLLVDAKDGIGWIRRGALFMSKSDGQWDIGGKQLISYPQ
jgi:hypothetical protein